MNNLYETLQNIYVTNFLKKSQQNVNMETILILSTSPIVNRPFFQALDKLRQVTELFQAQVQTVILKVQNSLISKLQPDSHLNFQLTLASDLEACSGELDVGGFFPPLSTFFQLPIKCFRPLKVRPMARGEEGAKMQSFKADRIVLRTLPSGASCAIAAFLKWDF